MTKIVALIKSSSGRKKNLCQENGSNSVILNDAFMNVLWNNWLCRLNYLTPGNKHQMALLIITRCNKSIRELM